MASKCLSNVWRQVTELDNLMFFVGLEEKLRRRVEYAGRIKLSEEQATELWWTKKVFTIMIPSTILMAPMPMGYNIQSRYIMGWMIVGLGYIITQGIAEYGRRETRQKGVAMAVGWTIAHAVLGTMGLGVCLLVSAI
jgi:hypothetical protein